MPSMRHVLRHCPRSSRVLQQAGARASRVCSNSTCGPLNTEIDPIRTVPVKHFVNLSNGAEALAPLLQAGLPPEQCSFVRIQSTHCERKDFNGVLSNLDHNLLIHLAMGFECRVYDFGSRSPPFVPRALWYGLEWSKYALARLWKLNPPPPNLRGHGAETMFEEKLCSVPEPLRRRLIYYRTLLANDCKEVRLRGIYAKTELDGKKDLHRSMLIEFLQASCKAQSQQARPPDPQTINMKWYEPSPPTKRQLYRQKLLLPTDTTNSST
mmetsp:Transcript_2664/g.5545  ORF Transcript_2664/g.5545 Transcript_2664/m.5545 type:complete len:267 (+) Transcript_2664:10-810(+)